MFRAHIHTSLLVVGSDRHLLGFITISGSHHLYYIVCSQAFKKLLSQL